MKLSIKLIDSDFRDAIILHSSKYIDYYALVCDLDSNFDPYCIRKCFEWLKDSDSQNSLAIHLSNSVFPVIKCDVLVANLRAISEETFSKTFPGYSAVAFLRRTPKCIRPIAASSIRQDLPEELGATNRDTLSIFSLKEWMRDHDAFAIVIENEDVLVVETF